MAYRILLSGGGTGGHLYPALNLAAALRRAEPDAEVVLLGARRGIEARVLPDAGWPYHLLPLEPLYRSRPWRNWRLVTRAPAVLGGLSRIFTDLRPHVVVGTGGYASGPAVAWAVARGVKTAIQEQNAVPGLATRVLASRVDQVHLGYPEARARIRPGRRTQVFEHGNPVAPGTGVSTFEWPEGPTILVFGGSQGALALNDLVLAGLQNAGEWPADGSLVWVTGPAHLQSVSDRLASLTFRDRVHLAGYIRDLGSQLDRVSLAVTRAGAMTCAELTAAGVPSVLVPLPTAAGDHQRFNAQAMVSAGAALMHEESRVSGAELWRDVTDLLSDGRRLASMAEASRGRGRPDAADRIAAELLELAAGAAGRGDD